MASKSFEKTIVLPKIMKGDEPKILSDRWLALQIIALLVSFLGLVALIVGYEAIATETPVAQYKTISPEQVETSLLNYLELKDVALKSYKVTIRRHSRVPQTKVPFGDLQWRWRGPELLTNGHRSVYALTLSNKSGWATRIAVNVSVRLKIPIFVAKATVFARKKIGPQNFLIREQEVVPSRIHKLVLNEIPSGYRSRGVIPQGAVLTQNHIQPLPLINKGAKVDILIREGGLSLRTAGIAQQEGGLGETINVRSLLTKKLFQVKVLTAQSVEVVW